MQNLFLICTVSASLFTATFAHAVTATIGDPTGASNYIAGAASTTPIIYGAIAGLQTDCDTTDANSFCNNCLGPNACSERRVHENLILRIPFTVTTETAGFIYFGFVDGSNYTEIAAPYTKSTTGTVGKGQSGYIEIAWGYILDALGSGSTGVTPENGTFFVAISPDPTISAEEANQMSIRAFAPGDNTAADIADIDCTQGKDGVCSFLVGPGDEKVYVDEVEPSGTYPTVDNVPVKFLRFYFANTGNVTDIDYSSNFGHVELSIDGSGAPEPNKIEGLVNEQYYGFKVAIVDEAYNISLLTSNNQITNAALDNCGTVSIDAAGYASGCPYITKASNVIGLLPEDVNCFISTAAFGSSMAAKVQDFRLFRNRILLKTDGGVSLVKAYYSFGPKAAKFIRDYPALKPVARAMLWPLWAYSTLSLKFGFGTTLLTFIFFSFGFAAVIVWGIIKCVRIQRPA